MTESKRIHKVNIKDFKPSSLIIPEEASSYFDKDGILRKRKYYGSTFDTNEIEPIDITMWDQYTEKAHYNEPKRKNATRRKKINNPKSKRCKCNK